MKGRVKNERINIPSRALPLKGEGYEKTPKRSFEEFF
jgi:hypothetical protein